MRYFCLLFLILTFLILSDCISTRKTSYKIKIEPIPNWYLNPPKNMEVIYTVGKSTTRYKNLSFNKAIDMAMIEMIKQIIKYYEEFEKEFQAEIQNHESVKTLTEFSKMADSIAYSVIVDTIVEKTEIQEVYDNFRVYILMKIPLLKVKRALIEGIKENEDLYYKLFKTNIYIYLEKEVFNNNIISSTRKSSQTILEEKEIIVDVANIRAGPGINYDILYQLNGGTIIKVLEDKDDWLKIIGRDNKEIAWVYRKITGSKGYYKKYKMNEGDEYYLDYYYHWKKMNGKYIALFNPFLPRDDATVIGAMLNMLNNIYGKNKLADLYPTIVNRNGVNVLKFRGISKDYLFLIMKEDSGEVYSITLWSE